MNEKKATGNITNNFSLNEHLPAAIVNKIIEAILYLEDKAQDNYDANLATQAKTILGAINEIANILTGLDDKMDKNNPTGTGKLQVNGVARGEKSVAIGDKVTAYGNNSVAEGSSNHLASDEVTDEQITDVVAAAEARNRNPGQNKTIEDFIDTWDTEETDPNTGETINHKFALAAGLFSKAEGANGLALAKGAHAEGNGTVAAGNASHAEGTGSKALNHYAHAGGLESIASGKRSFAHGYRTRAIYADQFVVGAYNEDDYDGLFIVGNGSEGQNGDPDVRQNAFVVTRDGKAEIGADVEDNDNEKTLIDLKYLREYFPTKDILDTSAKVDAVKEAGLYRVAFTYSLTGTGDSAYGEMLSIPYKSTDSDNYYGAQLFFANGDYDDGKQNCLWYRTINGTTWNNWVKIDPANLQAKLISGTNIKTVGNQSLLGSGNVSFKTINNENIVGDGNIEIQGCLEEIETLAAFCGDGGLYNNNNDECKVITEAHEKFVIEGKEGASGDLILEYKDSNSDELAVGVGTEGFINNTDITSVLMPDTMKYIRSYAFKGNTNLESIHLSNNLFWIENNAFEDCTSLTSIELPKFYFYSLGDEVFKGCTNLIEIAIPSSVTSIGEDVFDGCPNLTVYCEAGSDIATYCEDNSINYVTTYGANLPDKHEVIANKVTSLSSQSTNIQYPSAKCMYDELKTKQTVFYKNTLDQVLVPNAQYDLGTSDQATLTLTLPVPKGTKIVSELNDNALEKTTGDVYILSDSGTLTAGSLAVVAGDWVEWNGTAWKKIDSYSCNEIYVAFKSGSTATSLTIVGNYEGDTSYLPSTDCICELSFKYICGSWVLVTKETALSA